MQPPRRVREEPEATLEPCLRARGGPLGMRPGADGHVRGVGAPLAPPGRRPGAGVRRRPLPHGLELLRASRMPFPSPACSLAPLPWMWTLRVACIFLGRCGCLLYTSDAADDM
eukprot:7283283-Prymnesium_polylepis.1